MPMPFLESAFPPLDGHILTPPVIGSVEATARAASLAGMQIDADHDDSRARRYWAALSSSANAGASLGALEADQAEGRHSGTVAPPPLPHAIPQHDSLRLHPIAQAANPFESLIEHTLHVHLPHPDAVDPDRP